MAKDTANNGAFAHEASPLIPKSRPASIASASTTSSVFSLKAPTSWITTIALICAILNCLWAGSVLIFSLYAPLFNEHLGYRQMQINAVSVATELGMYLPGPVFGFICDRYGPAKLSLLSGVFFGTGYLTAAAAYQNVWDYKVMVAAFALIGAGTSAMYFAGVTTCAKNFTGRRGLALAVPNAAFGLSSLWQAQVVSRMFMGVEGLRVEKVFLFFAVALMAVGVIGSLGLRVEEEVEEEGEIRVRDEEDEKRWVNKETRAFLKDPTMWGFATGVFLVTGPGEAFINNVSISPSNYSLDYADQCRWEH